MTIEQLKSLEIVLASASPRRSELLSAAGFQFSVRVANIDETPKPDELPSEYVGRLSAEKASAVANPGETVLGADTTVVIDDEILAKPLDLSDTRRMLKQLSGRWHEVMTGLSVVSLPDVKTEVAVTRVKFAEMSDYEINWYAETGEPADKAGAYAIQGLGSRFIERIEGSYSNVVGLPLETLYRILKTGASK